jgi:hypothetical protein
MKIFLNKSLYFLYFGQLVSAIAQPFILNSSAKIASTWFREDKVKFYLLSNNKKLLKIIYNIFI